MHINNIVEYAHSFENTVNQILKNVGFNAELTKPNAPYDITATKDNITYAIEVKSPRNKHMQTYAALNAARHLMHVANNNEPVLVIGAVVKDDIEAKLQSEEINISVLDISNLLFFVQDNALLKSELLSLLDFSVDDITPKAHHNFPVTANSGAVASSLGEDLQKRITNWVSDDSTAYEKLCLEALKYLFDSELSLWKEQEKSNADLYRFDLICRIKDGPVSGFWSTLLQHFNSKYIIFEFKNYTGKITQREIYTTDKYLYLKALRSVAIIISRNGNDANADKAIRGTLRENGKLILSLSNDDLLNMVDMKLCGSNPSDYLYDKFDELMIDLEK